MKGAEKYENSPRIIFQKQIIFSFELSSEPTQKDESQNDTGNTVTKKRNVCSSNTKDRLCVNDQTFSLSHVYC